MNSIEKALKILLILAAHEQGMGTGELSEELVFTMPTVSRLLRVLAKHGFVQKQPEGKKYVLGKASLDIGRFAHKHIGSQLAVIARHFIDDLLDAVEEKRHIGGHSGGLCFNRLQGQWAACCGDRGY